MFSKVVSFCLSHKFSIEVASIGVAGITIPELAAADHLVKIVVGLATLVVIFLKEKDRRKKEGQ